MMIFVSAGHHPAKPGARFDRFVEHDEAVVWVEMICDRLSSATPVPTGVLRDKVDFINERVMNGDIAIEIHFNAAKNAEGENVGRGSETLYYPGSESGETLAQRIQSAMADVYPPDRGVKEGWYRMDPSRGADFFLAKTKCPAVILEPDFVHRHDIIINRREECVDALVDVLRENYHDSDVEEVASNTDMGPADTGN